MGNIFDIFKKLEQERGAESSLPVTHIVAGLGNPGDKYHWNHHNLGFLALDCIEQQKASSSTVQSLNRCAPMPV